MKLKRKFVICFWKLRDQNENGDVNALHVIVFDDIDSSCSSRGTFNIGISIHEGAVSQLLKKINSTENLDNVIVIGMPKKRT